MKKMLTATIMVLSLLGLTSLTYAEMDQLDHSNQVMDSQEPTTDEEQMDEQKDEAMSQDDQSTDIQEENNQKTRVEYERNMRIEPEYPDGGY